jgi:hypothetical protein
MPITANNLVQAGANLIIVNNWLMFPFIMAFAAFITVFFYLSVPFVASAVMKGLSGTTASLQAGVQGAMQTAGLIAGAGLTVAGAQPPSAVPPPCRRPSRERKRPRKERLLRGGLPTTSRARAGLSRVRRVPQATAPIFQRRRLRPPRLGERFENRSNPAQVIRSR